MKKLLISFCRSIGIEYVGIAPVEPFQDYAEIWRSKLAKGHITGLEEKDLDLRVDPRLTMETAKSAIVCLFPYYAGENQSANLSSSAHSIDYHILVKHKLELIALHLQSLIEGFQFMSFVDNGPLSDRHLAYLAGLGFIGLNSNLINDKYGSYVFIGYILNNYDFEPDQPQSSKCMSCKQCIENCPGNALTGDCGITPLLCRSYITQKKGELSENEIAILSKGNLIYGCDICQKVCPHNADIPISPFKEFKENLKFDLKAEDLYDISNKEFGRRYKDRAFAWRGKGILKRNYDILHGVKNRVEGEIVDGTQRRE